MAVAPWRQGVPFVPEFISFIPGFFHIVPFSFHSVEFPIILGGKNNAKIVMWITIGRRRNIVFSSSVFKAL
jgi:hypothetical protein